jgi:hypothetical protein
MQKIEENVDIDRKNIFKKRDINPKRYIKRKGRRERSKLSK